MSPKITTKDYTLKKPLIKLASIFGITPFYNFEKQKLIRGNLFKLYGLLLATVVTTGTIVSYDYHKNETKMMSALLSCLKHLLVGTVLVLFLVTVLGASFWTMQPWKKMLKLLSNIDNNTRCTIRYFLNVPFMILVFEGTHASIFLIYILINFDVTYAAVSCATMVVQYCKILTVCLTCAIIDFIRSKYKTIDNILTDINCCAVIKNSTLKKIRGIQELYVEADKMVELFNEIFGWPLLLILAVSVEVMLISLALITEHSFKPVVDFVIYRNFLILNSYYVIIAIVSI